MTDAPFVRVGPAARRDIDAQVIWLRGEAGSETAARLAEAIASTFAKLASLPRIGSPIPTQRPELAGLRKWRVGGFPKVLVFYLPVDGGIRVVRVLHAAQNWLALLERD